MKTKRALPMMALSIFITFALLTTNFEFKTSAQAGRPVEIDVRGPQGVPKGTALIAPLAGQLKSLTSLQARVGAPVQVRYNGLTATPRHLFSYSAYLTPPSSAPAETVARDFLFKWRDMFRFSDGDLESLRLKSRATTPDTGTTILLFEQQAGGLPVYHGEVVVNVNRAGQIINVGGESFPQMKITNTFALSPQQAVSAAARELGVTGFNPQSLGPTREIATYGDLAPQYVEAEKFSGGVFTDDIVVSRTVFPLGSTGRMAYKFVLTTPQYNGIMWEHVVDAQTGQVLRRLSLTAFLGQRGGGQGTGRLATFRPDVQDMVEAFNQAGTASGKVFDGMPTALSGAAGVGRTNTPGVAPTYAPENSTAAPAVGFRFSQVNGRYQNPLVYSPNYGQVLRGFPDALNPTPSSPFGWFYLPTMTGGAEITESDARHAATRAYGYTMTAEARARNVAANSPAGDGNQPFSATLTSLGRTVATRDGRFLSSVFQSNYTEGNNVIVADDHVDDNESTHGIKGFSFSRQFTDSHFDFVNSYEFGGVDAGGDPFFPPSTYPDVYPAVVTLFYYNNILHDYTYSVGFTESLWNFQQDNFGTGGAAADALSAQVMDGSGVNNANMGTPADGLPPRMQMYLFTEASQRRSDGDLDFDVVAHEFYHGVSNRSAAKGGTGGLGLALVGESGGQGEGWSDFVAASMTDDDCVVEYPTGNFDIGIRRMPLTNYRWSYGGINGPVRRRRDQQPTDLGASVPFEVHDIGEVWAATLWDMRELFIMKDSNGVFFDGPRRLGAGSSFYIGNRRVQSVDSKHPIEYRTTFSGLNRSTINPSQHIVRPGLVAAEIAARGDRQGPLAKAVIDGARLADTLVLRGLQLSPMNPSFVDSRDAILLADRELTGGENQALIWRAFASHGVGVKADSTASGNIGAQSAPVVIEDFTVPSTVTQCEAVGPLAAPPFTVKNLVKNQATITINDGLPVRDAATYVISRGTGAQGPFVKIAEVPAADVTFRDTNNGSGLNRGETFYYQVRAARNADCVSSANTRSVTIAIGDPVNSAAPVFFGIEKVEDPHNCSSLELSWRPATSSNPAANIVYDVYRSATFDADNGTEGPKFTPSAANRIASGVTGLSYSDTTVSRGTLYYYIVQARDTASGKKDTNNAGNTKVRFNVATTPNVSSVESFAKEEFESASANTRFVPPLIDSAEPDVRVLSFQRVPGVQIGDGLRSSVMFAPDFSPAEGQPDPGGTQGGGLSDFSSIIGPLNLTATSFLEFDHLFRTEAAFDGGVIEIALGAPVFNANPFPNNVNTFDAVNFIVQGTYNGKLDGTLVDPVILSPLQGRRAYTGTKELHHVRVALGAFAPGGVRNPLGLPVFVRFRMTSDVATSAGPSGGWYIDNLAIINLAGC